ncbi:MAG TPA: Gfo/Idh/MocA family oxidoreductase [Azospirillaceae bacterium]|nr:Gfo/Idh/MocA family oxidoreductase [Azospirillaceae bacterium]
MDTIRIALVGIGKIARDQHVPALRADPAFELAAAVTRGDGLPGVPAFRTLADLAASGLRIDAVSFCTPPQGRYAAASEALGRGYHVMLEKPPGATVAEVEALAAEASRRGLALFASWHSREAPAVRPARAWLEGRRLRGVKISWKEDVRRWHPGQAWIWEPGGLGVFDPGINALSIATSILPAPLLVQAAELSFPENRQAPIAATLRLASGGVPVEAVFDWRQEGPQTWDIEIDTDGGQLRLTGGGAGMSIDGTVVDLPPEAEYPGLYARFAELVRARAVDADIAPLRIVADAFLVGRRAAVAPFHD